MNDYIPFANTPGPPSPHDLRQPERDPWWVWTIAASPLLAFGALLFNNAVVLAAVAIATVVGCVWLAKRDGAASSWLAVVPAVFLLMRASRRAAQPHKGNPLAPLVVHLVLGFALSYYVLLFLAGMAGIVNRGG